MFYQQHFDVIVVGGGHAGTEAALASARMGTSTLLLTHNIETLGQMSCNPAIGGIGKGHLVKEIDALGGAMAKATDKAGIQFRTLNSSKGPAVRATRAQADRSLYRNEIRKLIENQENLTLFQQSCDDLIVEQDRVVGVVTQMGLKFHAKTVVITVGTFLGGTIHIGMENYKGGRAGDPPSIALADRLRALPFRVDRLKTGTPARLDARTLNFDVMQKQHGDTPVPVFSYMGQASDHPQQIPCYITHTNEKTHEIIRGGLDRSPMYTGVIEGIGPRYCPSIEDKIHRFADKNSHQIFVEPEGLNSIEVYPNGISTSLPFDVQMNFVRSIIGFENAHIVRPGYAIEYDFFDPRDLKQLTAKGHEMGLIDEPRWKAFNQKLEAIELERQRLKSTWVYPSHESTQALNVLLKNPVTKENTLEDLIRRPEMTYQTLMQIAAFGPEIENRQAAEQVEIQIKYAGYIERQKDEIAKTLRNENTLIPMDFDFSQISGLSNEVVAKLTDTRPETIGKAGRISGITPAAVSLLLVYLKKHGLLIGTSKDHKKISA